MVWWQGRRLGKERVVEEGALEFPPGGGGGSRGRREKWHLNLSHDINSAWQWEQDGRQDIHTTKRTDDDHDLLQWQSKDIQNCGSHNLSTVVKDDTKTPQQCECR